MDEPDAHLHEGRKPALCNMMREYPNRQIVIATHSPIMAQIANEKELLMLELENGKSTILTDEKIEKIKKLSGTSWDVIGQGMMLRSSRPLVVFEGKTDVMYVKRALEMLKSRVTDYASLNVDFLNANGAGNVKSFIDNLKAFVPDSKKIVVFFDRDNAGKDGVQAITGISKNDGRVAHYQDIVQDNITTSFIPYKDGVTEGDFLIEDYFSWDDTIKAIVEDLLDDECVESAKVMATVYTAIAAFENMVRQFVVKILMENKGENWWTECVSDKIRKSADSRKAEEDKIKWHTHRGTSMINYVDFADLANIMGQNYDLFEVHIVSLEWAKQIFTTLEKSRNVIMHSGELGERDIERIGINIRDWISQVGA